MPNDNRRRPPSRSDARRPARGRPTVPRRNHRQETLNAIPGAEHGAQILHNQGNADQAADIRRLIAYLGTLGFGEGGLSQGPTQNLQIYMDQDLASHFLEQAENRSELTAHAQRGLDLFLSGQWTPTGPIPSTPSRRGAGPKEKTALSVTVPTDVVEKANAKAEDLASAKGWSRMNKAGRIVISYLIHFYGTPADPTVVLRLAVDEKAKDHILDRMDRSGSNATAEVRKGFEQFASGAWTPAGAPSRKGGQLRYITATAPASLVEKVQGRVESLDEPEKWLDDPKRIAAAYLIDRYGLPEEEDTGGKPAATDTAVKK